MAMCTMARYSYLFDWHTRDKLKASKSLNAHKLVLCGHVQEIAESHDYQAEGFIVLKTALSASGVPA